MNTSKQDYGEVRVLSVYGFGFVTLRYGKIQMMDGLRLLSSAADRRFSMLPTRDNNHIFIFS